MEFQTDPDLTANLLTFYTLTGTALSFPITGARIITDEDEIVTCKLTLEVPYDTYIEWVDGAELFYLWHDIRQPQSFAFTEGLPFEITIHLHHDLLSDLELYVEESFNVVDLLNQLHDEEANNPLLKTNSWFAETVLQEEPIPENIAKGTVKGGYSTIWRGERAVGKWFFHTVAFLRQQGWNFSRYTEASQPTLEFKYSGGGLTWEVVVQARENLEQCLVYSKFPHPVPMEKRLEFAAHLHRINYDLPIGNFELNLENGEIRYKTSVDAQGQTLNLQSVQNLIYPNVLTVERYVPVFLKVLNDGDWDDALAEIDE